MFIEAKGKLDASNRKRLIAFKAQYPEIKLTILFQRDNFTTSSKKEQYTDWATKHGFPCTVGVKNLETLL